MNEQLNMLRLEGVLVNSLVRNIGSERLDGMIMDGCLHRRECTSTFVRRCGRGMRPRDRVNVIQRWLAHAPRTLPPIFLLRLLQAAPSRFFFYSLYRPLTRRRCIRPFRIHDVLR